MSFEEVMNDLKQKDEEAIVLPRELDYGLTKCQRNLAKLLCEHPKGIYSKKLFELLGKNNPSSARYASKSELAKYGLVIHVTNRAQGSEALWTIRRIEVESAPMAEEIKEKIKFNIGDTVWFPMCKLREENIRGDDFIFHPKEMTIGYAILENKSELLKAESIGLFSSHIHALKSLSSHAIALIK